VSLTESRVADLLAILPTKTVLVVGDFFLDDYLFLDPALTETSLETSLSAYQVLRVQRQPGAAGTVVNNLRALGVGRILALGICGADGEGFELQEALRKQRVELHLLERAEIMTPTYRKPVLLRSDGVAQEMNRFDTKNRTPTSTECEDEMIERFRRLLPEADAVIIADQVQERNCGVITDRVRAAIASIASEKPSAPFIADSRERIALFTYVMTKPNDRELSRLFDIDHPGEIDHPDQSQISLEELAAMGQELARRAGRTVFATCGARGMIVADILNATLVPAVEVPGPVDIVGAGDSATAGILCGFIAGLDAVDAAALGNLVASITVQKLGTTGTASPSELRARARQAVVRPTPIVPDWRQRPLVMNSTSIEVIRRTPPAPIHSAIFDFDGTLSLIREGWQDVMIPYMVEELAALGTDETREALQTVAREFVFRLTGKQTIYQFIHLASEIERRNGTPRNPQEYKQEYHRRLWRRIQDRVAGLKSGRIEPVRMLVPGSIDLLSALRDRGVRLYLASGTDLGYVLDESSALGLERFFEDRIYAAVEDYQHFSKQRVIQQIIREHALSGPELVAFGDGYVEIENAREAGGRTIGAATDERRPGRLDRWKRNRLIAAGADIIVPDFSEAALLLQHLQGHRY